MSKDNLIQFRLKDNALDALEALLLPGETLNLCAQRLLIEVLGVDNSKAVDTCRTVDRSVDNDDFLVDRLAPKVQAQIEAHLGDLVINLVNANLPTVLENLVDFSLPAADSLLNQLRARNPKLKLSLKDLELILDAVRGDGI